MSMRLERAEVRFGGLVAVRNMDLAIEPARITAVIGPNAAGKSTVLRVLAGVQALHAGTVSIDGVDLGGMPGGLRARRIGLLPQRGGVSGPFLTREVVEFGTFARDRGALGFWSVDAAIAAVGLEGEADRPLNRLSVGQQQRAGLARAMVQVDPSDGGVLLLDEPFSAQDPREIERIAAILREFRDAGGTVVAAMHEVGLAWSVADEAILLDRGELRRAGVVEEVLAPPALEALFGTPFVRTPHGPVPDSRRRDASAVRDG